MLAATMSGVEEDGEGSGLSEEEPAMMRGYEFSSCPENVYMREVVGAMSDIVPLSLLR